MSIVSKKMNYDVVIATRNRTGALKLSIPLILKQGRKPSKLIVVDASDDHEQVRQVVFAAVGDCLVEVEILRSEPNASLQRNVGLERVKSAIVMFPDDDSLWWPGVAEAIMRIYEKDLAGDIGGVCARETKDIPPGINLAKQVEYKMRLSDRIRQRIERTRHKFEDHFFPDPQWVHGRACWKVRPLPEFLSVENAALVEYMGGFRMSFRTKVIREFGGFDEDLGSHIGWAACEDADASFKVLKKYLIVGAHDARVFHYKAPNRRAGGYDLGFITLFNRAYVISRHSLPGSPARRSLKKYGLYKLMLYAFGSGSNFGRQRVRGIFDATRQMKTLLNSPTDLLRNNYLKICQEKLLSGAKN